MKKITLVVLLGFSFSSLAQNTKYFRQLRYNHVSPFIEIVGTHPIDSNTASKTSHYIFKYDTHGRILEIINNHFHTEKVHPLASLGVHKVVFTYENGKEIRAFYNPNNIRITNDKNVFKEVYLTDENNVKKQLNFYDLDDKPMESNWQITEYQWQQTTKYIVEKRFNLKGEVVNLSPYFEFGITGIIIDKNGAPKGHYNLNENLEVVDNHFGTASYQDTYDTLGNHIQYSYHDKKDKLITNQWGYAKGRKEYDPEGNFISLSLFDKSGTLLNTRKRPSNASIELAKPVTKKDSSAIKNIALGYLIALQELKPDLMKNVFHPELAKRTLGYDRETQQEVIRETTFEQMVEFAKSWNKAGNKFPPNPSNKVVILDIYNRIASVKLISDNWVEYLHLIQTNNEWDIINLLWQYKDIKRYPKLEK